VELSATRGGSGPALGLSMPLPLQWPGRSYLATALPANWVMPRGKPSPCTGWWGRRLLARPALWRPQFTLPVDESLKCPLNAGV